MRHRFATLLIAIGLLGALSMVPAAAGAPELPEEDIFLLCGFDGFEPCITEFPAGEPFFISHGVGIPHGQGSNQKGLVPAPGHVDFELYVNDVEVEEDWTFHFGTSRFTLFVFPEGMPLGEVTFTGVWYSSCSLDDIGVVEGCDKPADVYPFFENTVPVQFFE